jgi:hypothetical protein
MGFPAIFPLWGVLMDHCAGEIAVYGLPSYFFFMGHCGLMFPFLCFAIASLKEIRAFPAEANVER